MTISWDAESLTLERALGDSVRYAAAWVRDQCEDCRGWSAAQRRTDLFDLPADTRIESVSSQGDWIEIRWVGEAAPSRMPVQWLESIAWPSTPSGPHHWTAGGNWSPYQADYASILENKHSRAEWLEALERDGIAFLRACPAIGGEVLRAADVLGYVLETNYGRLFRLRAESSPDNLAYTALGLGLHTDNPYRDPVPGYQLLHCLINSDEGGDSLFADGYAAAARLRETDLEAFWALCTIPVDFRYADALANLNATRTLIELDNNAVVRRIHWNTRSISTARLPPVKAPEFYRAGRVFSGIINSPEFVWQTCIQPGDLVAFDNGRLLHGRTAFRGERLLEGCYLSRDSVVSNLAVLRRNYE